MVHHCWYYGLWLLLVGAALASASFLSSLSERQAAVFKQTFSALEANFAPPYIFASSRYTSYYAVGLLARNEPGDVDLAVQLFDNAIAAQAKNESEASYGAFLNPNLPKPSDIFPPRIYGSYDPNSNLFVATAIMIAIEEFGHLLPPDSLDKIVAAGYRATVGDTRRVAGVDDDNLRPAYSNPWLMRCACMAYYGNLQGDWNMTDYAERYAGEFYDLFDLYETLSEFNSATYVGVSLFAITLGAYLPQNTTLGTRYSETISKVWDKTALLYHPELNTLGGSWDRTYGYPMKQYVSLLGYYVAGLVGDPSQPASWPLPHPQSGSAHFGDAAFGPLIVIVSKYHDHNVSEEARQRLMALKEPRFVQSQAVSPPFDAPGFGPRNYTAYNGPGIAVGGTAFDQEEIGGQALSTEAFTPGVLMWSVDSKDLVYPGFPNPQVGWMILQATAGAMSVTASSTNLTIQLPLSCAFPETSAKASQLTLLFGVLPGLTLSPDFLVTSNSSGNALPGIRLDLSGPLASGAVRSFTFDPDATINGFENYNLTFTVNSSVSEVTELVVAFKKEDACDDGG